MLVKYLDFRYMYVPICIDKYFNITKLFVTWKYEIYWYSVGKISRLLCRCEVNVHFFWIYDTFFQDCGKTVKFIFADDVLHYS